MRRKGTHEMELAKVPSTPLAIRCSSCTTQALMPALGLLHPPLHRLLYRASVDRCALSALVDVAVGLAVKSRLVPVLAVAGLPLGEAKEAEFVTAAAGTADMVLA